LLSSTMKKILLIDDSLAILNLLEHFLSKQYAVRRAENGKEGLEVLSQFNPDLILVDLLMPVMDGITAIGEIRKLYDGANLPIIVLSGVEEKDQRVKALNAGANDFVSKPFDKTELLSRIANNLSVSELSKELARTNRTLQEEKRLARNIQESILPSKLDFDCLEVATFYQASNQLGGDFFDAWEKDNKIHLLIADVSGHGTGSALLMAACKSIFYTLGQSLSDPLAIIVEANRIICEMVEASGMFLTAVYALFDKELEELQVVSAGHNPVFMMDQSGVNPIASTGIPLGLFQENAWEVSKVPFQAGQTLFMYTDGLVESTNQQEEMYGEELLLPALQKEKEGSPQKIVDSIFQSVKEYCNDQFNDDLTILVIKRVCPA